MTIPAKCECLSLTETLPIDPPLDGFLCLTHCAPSDMPDMMSGIRISRVVSEPKCKQLYFIFSLPDLLRPKGSQPL